MTELEARIRERAIALWKEAGRPAGRDEEFWLEAELQIAVEERGKPLDPPTAPRS